MGERRHRRAAGAPATIGLALALALALGCVVDEGQTCEVATEELSAVALVVDSGWDIRATIDFEAGDRRGRNEPLRLCEDERLTINGVEPEPIEKADRIEYALALPADGVRSFGFVLQREDERIELALELPPPFELLAPMDGDLLDFSAGQELQWEPAWDGGSMQVGLSEEIGGGDCLVTAQEGHTYESEAGVTVPDSGQWTIPGGVLESGSPQDCTVTYTLSRVLLAPYPEVLHRSGRAEARTERYVDVVVF